MIFCLKCKTKTNGTEEGYYYCKVCKKFSRFFTL